MSAVVDNAVKTTQPQGVFSRAFAKRAQPYEEGESFHLKSLDSTMNNFWFCKLNLN